MRKVNMPIVTLIKDGDDLILPLTDPVFADMGLEIGDTMVWKDNDDGSWTLSKKPKTKIVMVDLKNDIKHHIDEEYYRLIDKIRENIVQYTEMDEQTRLAWVRKQLEMV